MNRLWEGFLDNMGEAVISEVDVIVDSLCMGMFLSATYDIFRIFRRVIKHGSVLIAVEDYIFWVIWGILIFVFIFRFNNGEVRGYVFVSLITGAIIYTKSISIIVVNVISKILNFLINILLKKPVKVIKIIFGKAVAKRRKCRDGKKKEEN